MKLLKAIYNFEFTVSGGLAVYFLMCVAFVTIVGLIQIGGHMLDFFKNAITQ